MQETTVLSPTFVRVPEFVRLTGMSRSEVYRCLYNGTLKARKIGKSWYIEAAELTEFFEREDERCSA